jgi:hypothetical protein
MPSATRYQNIISAVSFWLALMVADVTLHVNVPGMLDLEARISRPDPASIPIGPPGRPAMRLPPYRATPAPR